MVFPPSTNTRSIFLVCKLCRISQKNQCALILILSLVQFVVFPVSYNQQQTTPITPHQERTPGLWVVRVDLGRPVLILDTLSRIGFATRFVKSKPKDAGAGRVTNTKKR